MDRGVYDVFTKIPTLFTDRLILRKIGVSDLADVYDYSRRPEVSRYLLWSPHSDPQITKSHLKYIQTRYAKHDFFDWAVVVADSGKMIGTCGFSRLDEENNSAEIGYVLNSDYWGMGYAAEAVRRIMTFAFDTLGFHRIYARILEGNAASERVAQKCGMIRESTHRRALIVKGEYKTFSEYAILKEEFDAMR